MPVRRLHTPVRGSGWDLGASCPGPNRRQTFDRLASPGRETGFIPARSAARPRWTCPEQTAGFSVEWTDPITGKIVSCEELDGGRMAFG